MSTIALPAKSAHILDKLSSIKTGKFINPPDIPPGIHILYNKHRFSILRNSES